MISIIFASSANFTSVKTIDDLSKNFEEINNIVLKDKKELEIFLKLIGLWLPDPFIIFGDFEYQYDMSAQIMQDVRRDTFDEFYANWIKLTERKNTTDEYGQLVFLIGKAKTWNVCLSRYILQEKP